MAPATEGAYGAELAQAVERNIIQRTWGRIYRLEVFGAGDHLVVRGCTASYYAKQLALEAVLDVLGSCEQQKVEMDIRVMSPSLPPTSVRSPFSPKAQE